MATGFMYTINTLTKDYVQRSFCNVPTQFGNRLYFGPCKVPMRPRINPNDYIFGISPSGIRPRRIVFIARVEERITFGEAYKRYPELRGPEGPIHVKPVNDSSLTSGFLYAHIPEAMHSDRWQKDLASQDLDAFFVCFPQTGYVGRWLGSFGPKIDDGILAAMKMCSLYGNKGELSESNNDATLQNPIVYKGPSGGLLFRGLHLETDRPKEIIELCEARISFSMDELVNLPLPSRNKNRRTSCGNNKPSISCR